MAHIYRRSSKKLTAATMPFTNTTIFKDNQYMNIFLTPSLDTNRLKSDDCPNLQDSSSELFIRLQGHGLP